MDYIRRLLFRFPDKKSTQKRKPEQKSEKLPNKSSIAESEPADKNEETSRTSIRAYLRSLFGFSERKPAQKRKRKEDDEITDGFASNAEGEPAGKKSRQNEEMNGISLDEVKCRICLDVVSCSVMTSLPCAHLFHENCLFQWLEISRVCPLCRCPTRIESGENYQDYDESEDNDEYWSENDESDSGDMNYESPLVGPRRESPWFGTNGESPAVERSIGESPPQRWYDTHDMSAILNTVSIDPTLLTDAIVSNEVEANGNEYQPESHELASERSSGVSTTEGRDSESQHDGLNDESVLEGLNSESSLLRSRNESAPNGSNGEFHREGWHNTDCTNDAMNISIFGPEEEIHFWNSAIAENNEIVTNGNECQPLSHELPSERSIGISPLEGSSGESQQDGLNCVSESDRLSDDIAQNRLSGETTYDRSSDIAHSEGWKKEST